MVIVKMGSGNLARKKGYICLESEGAPIHFRNADRNLSASGRTSAEQFAPLLSNPNV